MAKYQLTANPFGTHTKKIPDDHELLSFDVKSLFTAPPLQLAIDCSTEVAIKNSAGNLLLNNSELPLLYGPAQPLPNFHVFSVQRQSNTGKQSHGTAMGSPVSVVTAEIVIKNITEQALDTYKL